MTYSNRNPAWDRMHRQRNDERIQAEARIAAEIQKKEPKTSRADALARAAQIVRVSGP